MGFLQICAGVVLLQMSKSAKDVPDAAVFKGDLDQVREIGEQEQPETEPKADAIRGAAALLRRISVSRQKREEAEARRYHEEKLKDQLEPLAENEIVQWDGLRRRKTVLGDGLSSPVVRRKTIHPPLGMSHFPDENEAHVSPRQHGFFETVRTRASSVLRTHQPRQTASDPIDANVQPRTHPVALTDIKVYPGTSDTTIEPYDPDSLEEAREHVYGLPVGLQKPDPHGVGQNSPRSKPLPAQPSVQSPAGAPNIPLPSPLGKSSRRQFSFQNMFRGPRSPAPGDHQSASSFNPPRSRSGIGSRSSSAEQKRAMKTATEEERLGLVKGDSHATLLDPDLQSYAEHDSNPYSSTRHPLSHEHYPYAATTQDSIASSLGAETPLVSKPSYLLSSSTMSDPAPLHKELHPPGYFDSGHGSGYSAPPPPLEDRAGVDDEWQMSTHRETQQPRRPPTPQSSLPTITTTSPPPPSPPTQEHSQLPAYHSNNPYQPPQQRLQEPARVRATAAEPDPFQSTPMSQHQNTTQGAPRTDKTQNTIRFDPSTRETQTRTQGPTQSIAREDRRMRQEAAMDLDQALSGIKVTSPEEQEFKERWRRLAQQQEQQQQKDKTGTGQNRGADRRDRGGGGGGMASGPAAGTGAFL